MDRADRANGWSLNVYTGEEIPIRVIREICGKNLLTRARTPSTRPRMARMARIARMS
jgi:hypothetical protein